ncbi:hypothetical protein BU26DRAFT_566199 [Trematosphaeria pertusa]|uniref:Uncharacterized protein n=1 Tax=Trematosphaeria pertusa TaxID=390896 RepID=A0A6A6I9G3_9PLEO|nr:uncharacterized protein BU26DRAFT_566199 [Trematosphaeria pertusa]KAF2247214.1 hypothetical protein BU26DRAFT_566199 [Trematosphaeria pertusa]
MGKKGKKSHVFAPKKTKSKNVPASKSAPGPSPLMSIEDIKAMIEDPQVLMTASIDTIAEARATLLPIGDSASGSQLAESNLEQVLEVPDNVSEKVPLDEAGNEGAMTPAISGKVVVQKMTEARSHDTGEPSAAEQIAAVMGLSSITSTNSPSRSQETFLHLKNNKDPVGNAQESESMQPPSLQPNEQGIGSAKDQAEGNTANSPKLWQGVSSENHLGFKFDFRAPLPSRRVKMARGRSRGWSTCIEDRTKSLLTNNSAHLFERGDGLDAVSAMPSPSLPTPETGSLPNSRVEHQVEPNDASPNAEESSTGEEAIGTLPSPALTDEPLHTLDPPMSKAPLSYCTYTAPAPSPVTPSPKKQLVGCETPVPPPKPAENARLDDHSTSSPLKPTALKKEVQPDARATTSLLRPSRDTNMATTPRARITATPKFPAKSVLKPTADAKDATKYSKLTMETPLKDSGNRPPMPSSNPQRGLPSFARPTAASASRKENIKPTPAYNAHGSLNSSPHTTRKPSLNGIFNKKPTAKWSIPAPKPPAPPHTPDTAMKNTSGETAIKPDPNPTRPINNVVSADGSSQKLTTRTSTSTKMASLADMLPTPSPSRTPTPSQASPSPKTKALQAISFEMDTTLLGTTSFSAFIANVTPSSEDKVTRAAAAKAFMLCVARECALKKDDTESSNQSTDQHIDAAMAERWLDPVVRRRAKLGAVSLAEFEESLRFSRGEVAYGDLWEAWKMAAARKEELKRPAVEVGATGPVKR